MEHGVSGERGPGPSRRQKKHSNQPNPVQKSVRLRYQNRMCRRTPPRCHGQNHQNVVPGSAVDGQYWENQHCHQLRLQELWGGRHSSLRSIQQRASLQHPLMVAQEEKGGVAHRNGLVMAGGYGSCDQSHPRQTVPNLLGCCSPPSWLGGVA